MSQFSSTPTAPRTDPTAYPIVRAVEKREWGQQKVFVAFDPCPHCQQPRHKFPVSRGTDPKALLGTVQMAPCGKLVMLTPDGDETADEAADKISEQRAALMGKPSGQP